MRFSLTREQTKLRDEVRRLLDAQCTAATIRAAWEQEPGALADPVAKLWSQLAEMGVLAAALPDAVGGLELGAVDVIPLLQEAGRAGLPLPLMETAFVAGPLLAGDGAHDSLVRQIADGELLVACALDGSDLVPFAEHADLILLSDDALNGAPVRLATGTQVTAVTSVDRARGLARLSDRSVGQVLALRPQQITAAWLRGTLGCSAQLVGLSQRLLEMTSAYVKERHQFGVPIGSFQAVKHHLADALIAIEFAAPAVMRAAWSIDRSSATATRDVAMAKALSSEAAQTVAATALQCHGAIAYTTDYDLHLYAKRIWSSVRTWGDAESQRAIVAAAIGL